MHLQDAIRWPNFKTRFPNYPWTRDVVAPHGHVFSVILVRVLLVTESLGSTSHPSKHCGDSCECTPIF